MRAKRARKICADFLYIRFEAVVKFFTSTLKDFFLQNTKFGVRVPFALLLAYRVPGFGVPNTL